MIFFFIPDCFINVIMLDDMFFVFVFFNSSGEPFNKPTRRLLGICIHNHPPCTIASVVAEKVL